MPVNLFYRRFGQGPPMIILHGLFGCSDNWVTVGKKLGSGYDIIIPDLRNHGQSFHSDEFNYQILADDVFDLIRGLSLSKVVLLGHSMGGKTAMSIAESNPDIISALLVADITPGYISPKHTITNSGLNPPRILEILRQLDLSGLKTRMQADRELSEKIGNKTLRDFLLKNLKTIQSGKYSWKLNLDGIAKNIERLAEGFDANHDPMTGFPVLFLKGEKSDYILPEDELLISKIFPQAEILLIKNAGHWMHAEQPEIFSSAILQFLSRSQ